MTAPFEREEVGVRIIVLGAGVVGVSSAYYLAKDGHEVVVVDREGEVGQDASAGNAGLIAPGHSYAWASPAAPKLMLGSLTGKKTSIRVKPRLDPDLVTWGVRFLRECTADRARRNTLVKHRLCRFSHGLIKSIAETESIDYAAEEAGMFYLYADEAELEAGFQKTALLRDNGEDLQLLDAAGVVEREPVLAHLRDGIAGAIFGATDASGDCEKFTKGLAERCRALGVDFQLGRTIHGLRESGGAVTAVQTTNGDIVGEGYVLALGVGSAGVGRSVGLRGARVSGEGLLGDVPGPRGRRVPARRRRRREHAGCVVAARRRAAHVLDGRVRRLRPQLDDGGLRRRPRDRTTAVPDRSALRPRPVPRVPAADDAGRAAADRAVEAAQPLVQHRPGPHGLDDGPGLRQARRGRDQPARARDRHDGHAGALIGEGRRRARRRSRRARDRTAASGSSSPSRCRR